MLKNIATQVLLFCFQPVDVSSREKGHDNRLYRLYGKPQWMEVIGKNHDIPGTQCSMTIDNLPLLLPPNGQNYYSVDVYLRYLFWGLPCAILSMPRIILLFSTKYVDFQLSSFDIK